MSSFEFSYERPQIRLPPVAEEPGFTAVACLCGHLPARGAQAGANGPRSRSASGEHEAASFGAGPVREGKRREDDVTGLRHCRRHRGFFVAGFDNHVGEIRLGCEEVKAPLCWASLTISIAVGSSCPTDELSKTSAASRTLAGSDAGRAATDRLLPLRLGAFAWGDTQNTPFAAALPSRPGWLATCALRRTITHRLLKPGQRVNPLTHLTSHERPQIRLPPTAEEPGFTAAVLISEHRSNSWWSPIHAQPVVSLPLGLARYFRVTHGPSSWVARRRSRCGLGALVLRNLR